MNFTDRYDALGIDYPDPDTVCDGQCEGTGFVPYHKDDQELKWNPKLRRKWRKTCELSHSPRIMIQTMLLFLKMKQFKIAFGILMDYPKWGECEGYHFLKCPDCDGTGKRNAKLKKGVENESR